MKFIADFHIHSHYSLATSKNLTPEYLDYWAQLKGVSVIGTGDCTHPGWLHELKEKLEPAKNGLYKLKTKYKLDNSKFFLPDKLKKEVFFIITGEISSIYKKKNKVRKVHSVCVLPDFESAQEFQALLGKTGNILSDGRPILGLDAKNILNTLLIVTENAFIIPAHIWTPWFSILGDKSGFNNIEECYEDLTPYIFALETGLSSDPSMNRLCSFLDRFRLVSNSDAHSPEKIGREANLFDTDLTYEGIFNSLKFNKGFKGTIEYFPHEGKYFYDGHRKCKVCWEPEQTIKNNCICTVCNRPVTKGVSYRINELADRKPAEAKKLINNFNSITSLPSIIAETSGLSQNSKKVLPIYFDVLNKIGSDFHTLLFADLNEIKENTYSLLAEGIKRLRSKEVFLQPGFDGEFGTVRVFKQQEINKRLKI